MQNNQKKIFLAEDNPGDVRLIKEYLSEVQDMSFELKVAETLTDSINQLQNSNFDLLLLDLNLPDSSGIETLDKISTEAQETAIIVLTGLNDEEIAVEALRKGAQDYLLKNQINSGILYRAIRYAIERKQIEEALRKSDKKYKKLYDESRKAEEVYRSLIHSSADAIVMYDLQGRVNYISPAFTKVFGWNFEEIKGKKIPFLPESEQKPTIPMIKNLVEKGIPCHGFETKRYNKEGKIIDVSISASRYDDHEGEPAGLLVILRDISEKKVLETKLRQAHKMEAVGTLAGGIAHDFNNILAGIMGYVEIAKFDASLKKSVSKNLDGILKGCYRAKELVEQILKFSRKSEQTKIPLQFSYEIKEAIKLLRASLPSSIEIRKNIEPGLGNILADPTQIHQVLMNLCTNASHAMGKGGGILDIKLKSFELNPVDRKNFPGLNPGGYLKLTIRDTGNGIDKNIIEKVFTPYFTTKEHGKGTGMGLALVHGIVKNHGGAITVSSKLGKGTTFDVYFPVNDSKINPKVKDTKPLPTGNECILFVDDEKAVVDTAKEALDRLGYHVVARTSSIEALEAFRSFPEKFDLVISDLTMPNMTGDNLAKELIQIRPNIPIIICSGFSQIIAEEDIKEIGIKDLLTKPFSIHDLANTIREILDDNSNHNTKNIKNFGVG